MKTSESFFYICFLPGLIYFLGKFIVAIEIEIWLKGLTTIFFIVDTDYLYSSDWIFFCYSCLYLSLPESIKLSELVGPIKTLDLFRLISIFYFEIWLESFGFKTPNFLIARTSPFSFDSEPSLLILLPVNVLFSEV